MYRILCKINISVFYINNISIQDVFLFCLELYVMLSIVVFPFV